MEKKRIRASKIVLQVVSISFSILLILLAVVGVYETGKRSYQFGYRIFTEEAIEEEPGEDVLVCVEKDTSAYELAQKMERKHLVRSANLFWVQLKFASYKKKIETGTYTLNTSMSPKKMLDTLLKEEKKEEKQSKK